MSKFLKYKENETQGEDAAKMSQWIEAKNPFSCLGAKPGYIARFCYKAKNKGQEQENNATDDDEYNSIFKQIEAQSKSVHKWIMDSGVSNHMISHRTTFHTYEIITLRSVPLSDNRIVQTFEMGSIVREVI